MKTLPKNRYVVFLTITAVGTVLDLWSKSAAFTNLKYPGQTDWLIDSWVKFKLHTSLNTGALWGIGQGKAWLFALLSIAAFFGVLYWLFIAKAARSMWLTVTMSMITAGTLGNLWDRLGLHNILNPLTGEPFQAVRDFLRFRFGTFEWATFNVADILLVAGAIMLVLHSFLQPETEEATKLASSTSA